MSSTQPVFYTAEHEFFNPGTKWDEGTLTIDKVEQFGKGKWDYIVYYTFDDGTKSRKDIWNFQVRHYEPGKSRPRRATPEEIERMISDPVFAREFTINTDSIV